MNANRQFGEDHLALYVMGLLPASQHSAVAQWVAEDPRARLLLLDVQAALAAFAEVAVEPGPVPEGSLDRLLERIGREPKRVAQPALVPKQVRAVLTPEESAPKHRSFPMWAGWAVAALLAVTVGLIGDKWIVLNRRLTEQNGQVATLSTEAANLRRDRNILQASLAAQTGTAATLKNEAMSAESSAAILHSKLAGESTKLNEETAEAAEAEREQNRLQGTITAQGDQLAQLSTATRDAQILAALTDPTALRVVLTKPKSKPIPTGRAAYIASKGTLVFLGSNLTPLKAAKVYELWLMPADGSSPIAAGTFLPDAKGNASLAYARFPRAVPAKGFAVTVENAGGSQVPTLPILLAGS